MSQSRFDLEGHMRSVALRMRSVANMGVWDGYDDEKGQRYINKCRRIDSETSTVIIFTRDTGHHSSGWMKNPDFERCFHLSLSPAPMRIIIPNAQRAELSAKTKAAWLKAFYGEDAKYTWEESAKSHVGKQHGVLHYRLFCDESWKPILPSGEVYSTALTELGWRSASQVLEEDGRVIISTVDPT